MGAHRCTFEDAVSGELLLRLAAYPKMHELLEGLPPKMLTISSDKPVKVIKFTENAMLTRVDDVIEQIRSSKFTGKGDMEKVPSMYTKYVARIARMLQETFAIASPDAAISSQLVLPPLPTVSAPPTPPIRLAPDQPLLVRDQHEFSDVMGWRLGVLCEDQRVTLPLLGGDVEISHDRCAQEAIPWKATAEGWDEALFVRNSRALVGIAERVQGLLKSQDTLQAKCKELPKSPTRVEHPQQVRTHELQEQLHDLRCQMEKQQEEVLRETALMVANGLICDSRSGVGRSKIDYAGEVIKRLTTTLNDYDITLNDYDIELNGTNEYLEGTRGRLQAARSRLQQENLTTREAIAKLTFRPQDVDDVAISHLRNSGVIGRRRYAGGQRLSVRHEGAWADAEVLDIASDYQHRLRIEDVGEATLPLHPWNHAARELPLTAFEALRGWWTKSLRKQHANLADALTGKQLDVLKQCVAIDVEGGAGHADIRDVHGLIVWLRKLRADMCTGDEVTTPNAVLLTAPPASGKTTLISQAVMLILEDTDLLPIVIKVQRLQAKLHDSPDAFAESWNWFDAYLRLEHTDRPDVYRMLRQAMMARRALMLLDGLDEGGISRDEIERHATEVLAVQGHVILCTSRPAGIDEARFASFSRLRLGPLTKSQQHEALKERLGGDRLAALLPYLERMPTDGETKQCVTANPLMLSMVASVFEIHSGVGMPQKITELYGSASAAMLSRGGIVSAPLRALLQAVFFEAHVAQQRVITEVHLSRAAISAFGQATKADTEDLSALNAAIEMLSSKGHEALQILREGVEQDRLPLLSLLQIKPLEVQASHLSFQEYFAARAICSGKHRLRKGSPPPWEWPAFWSNATKLGAEMGDEFGKGLMQTAGLDAELNLKGKLGGDRETTVAAVAQLIRGLTSLDLSHNMLSATEVKVLTDELITSASMTSLDISNNGMGDEGVKTICEALKKNKTLKVLALNASKVTGGEIGPQGAKYLAEMLGVNASVTQIDLSGNYLGDEGAKALAPAIAINASVTSVDVGFNSITQAASLELLAAMKGKHMVSIGMASCELGVKGSKVVAAMISGMTSLTSINLRVNRLGPEGAEALAPALRESASVTSINLRWNHLGPEGANTLAPAIRDSASLRSINLKYNKLGPEGAKALAPGIRASASLTTIDLGGNHIGSEGAEALVPALRDNPSLSSIDLQLNFMGVKGEASLRKAVEGRAGFEIELLL